MSTPSTTSTRKGRGRARAAAANAPSLPVTPASTMSPSRAESVTSIDTRMSNIKLHSAEQEELMALVMKRPPLGGKGTLGDNMRLYANTFAVTLPDDDHEGFRVQRYEVTIECAQMKKMLKEEKRDCFWAFIEANPQYFAKEDRTAIIYDDSAAMYTILPRSKLPELKFELRMSKHFEWTMKACDFTCRFHWTQETLLRLNVGGDNAVPVQIIDILLSQLVRCPLMEESRSWYPYGSHLYGIPSLDRSVYDLSGGIELWSGFHDAIKLGESGQALLNVNIAMSAFYRRSSVLQFMIDAILTRPRDEHKPTIDTLPNDFQLSDRPNRGERKSQIQRLKEALKGLKLKTTHMAEGKNRTYRFHDVHDPPGQITFQQKRQGANGEEVVTEHTVLEYFEQQYGSLRFPNLQTLHVGSRSKVVYIPIEHLAITDTVPQKVPHHRVTGEQTGNLIRQAAIDAPEPWFDSIHMTITCTDPFSTRFGVTVANEMTKVMGRTLEKPELVMSKEDQPFTADHVGGWTSRFERFRDPVQNIMFSVIRLVCRQDETNPNHPDYQISRDFFDAFVRHSSHTFGMSFANDKPVNLITVQNPAELPDAFGRITKEFSMQYGQDPSITPLIFVEMPGKDPHVYSIVSRPILLLTLFQIKRLGDIKHGIITQCLLKSNVKKSIMRNGMRTCSANMFNIIIKLNTKLGGTNCALYVDKVWASMTEDRQTMFVGVDVTHPGPTETDSPSIGAVVANTDKGASKYAVNMRVQRTRREAMVYMKDELRARLMAYLHSTKCRPTHIVVYRDGVGESEFGRVLKEELASARAACNDIEAGYNPKITYIVVQKRHHMRFFCGDPMGQSKGRAGNVPMGTVVDSVITHPTFFDFYLVSHFGPMGTSRPAHYCVLHDDAGWTADELQACTYKLCHMFGRCAKSVSIPAPVYYAHHACTRARMHYKGAMYDGDYDTSMRGGSLTSTSTGDTEAHLQAMVTVGDAIKELPYFV